MKTPSHKLSPFQTELLAEVGRIQRDCQRDGTTALGMDCLFQHLQFRNLPSAPRGTNCRWVMMQDLREVCGRYFGSFILP